MAKHFNDLSPAEAERLALLAEECAEVIQVVGKILRHGYESTNPEKRNDDTNRDLLVRELGDVWAATHLMLESGDVFQDQIDARVAEKLKAVLKYLHHQDALKGGAT